MKTKVVGYVYLICMVLLSVGSIIGLLGMITGMQAAGIRGGGIVEVSKETPIIIGMVSSVTMFVFGIIGIVWSLALVKHKKWSYYFGIVFVSIIVLTGIYYVTVGKTASIIGVLFGIFALYALVSEKQIFTPIKPVNS